MQNFAISVVLQIINIVLLVSWIVLSVISLFKIKNKTLSSTAKAIWVLIVICVPILGAIALFIVNPSESRE
jgi:flagellar biosynthesis protein FliQ